MGWNKKKRQFKICLSWGFLFMEFTWINDKTTSFSFPVFQKKKMCSVRPYSKTCLFFRQWTGVKFSGLSCSFSGYYFGVYTTFCLLYSPFFFGDAVTKITAILVLFFIYLQGANFYGLGDINYVYFFYMFSGKGFISELLMFIFFFFKCLLFLVLFLVY